MAKPAYMPEKYSHCKAQCKGRALLSSGSYGTSGSQLAICPGLMQRAKRVGYYCRRVTLGETHGQQV